MSEESILPRIARASNIESARAYSLEKAKLSRKVLIIMMGYPGAGKTTTAHRLRRALSDTMVVSRDYFRLPYKRESSLKYTKSENDYVDSKFYKFAEAQLSLYSVVVLDATFRERTKRLAALGLARKQFCEPFLILCRCSHEINLQRLQRQQLAGEKTFTIHPKGVLEYYTRSTENLKDGELEILNFIQLDTEKDHISKFSLKSSDDNSSTSSFASQITEILTKPFNFNLHTSDFLLEYK